MTKVLWFTGLSGSGKTTIANKLTKELINFKKTWKIFDGDEVRKNFHKHLGFTPKDIKENNRLIVALCKNEIGNIDFLLVSIISPFKEDREYAKSIFRKNFIEIYVDCPIEECEKRDVKGHYKKIREGNGAKNFIGISVPYEIPENPDIILNTVEESVEESIKKILIFLGF